MVELAFFLGAFTGAAGMWVGLWLLARRRGPRGRRGVLRWGVLTGPAFSRCESRGEMEVEEAERAGDKSKILVREVFDISSPSLRDDVRVIYNGKWVKSDSVEWFDDGPRKQAERMAG